MENINTIPRPVWSDAIRGHRAEVWFWRSRSAWDLAARLEKALAPYRCRLCNYGLYPSIVDTDTRETLSFLHYFD